MQNHIWALLFLAIISQKALSQDSPMQKPGGPNDPNDGPPQKTSSGGIPGGGFPGGGIPPGLMKKFATPATPAGFYGVLDVRHTTNDYFDEEGQRLRRDPALHAKLRIGGRFYGNTVDISTGVGGTKLPASQRVYQNRPDIMVDVYPIKGQMLNFLVYANAMLPVRSEDQDPTEFSDGDRYDRDYRRAMDATVMTAGLAPNFKAETILGIGRVFILAGANAWTRMYSKPLYIQESDGSRDLGLLSEKSPLVEKAFEDRAMRYVHQETVGIGYSPSFYPKLKTEIAGYYESRYLPEYSQSQDSGTWNYIYRPERASFTRFKAELDLTHATSLSNEFYYLRNGFFAEDRINEERRFKNIVRLAFKL
jgi:hypothetical protein